MNDGTIKANPRGGWTIMGDAPGWRSVQSAQTDAELLRVARDLAAEMPGRLRRAPAAPQPVRLTPERIEAAVRRAHQGAKDLEESLRGVFETG